MKVAFINQPWNDAVPPVQSGSLAIWTYQVARYLARSCKIIVYGPKRLFQKKIIYDEGVQYRYIWIGLDRAFLKLLNPFSLSRNFKHPLFASTFFYLGYILQVAADLRKQQCDIVHIWNLSQFVPIIRSFNPRIAIVLHMQCEWLTQLNKPMIQRRLQQVDLVIACSNYITNKIRQSFPHIGDRCHTIYNAVDVEAFSPARRKSTRKIDKKKLLFVGRVSPEKGVHVLIDAFKTVVEQCPEAQLEIIGPQRAMPIEFAVALSDDPKTCNLAEYYSGSYISYLKTKVSSCLANSVNFLGPIPYTNLITYYRDADIFLFPSVWHEPFGMPIVEAMACGVPVIGTQSGGISEIIEDAKTGILVERGDALTLAKAVLYILENEEMTETLRRAARKRAVELFSWQRTSDKLLRRYNNIYGSHE